MKSSCKYIASILLSASSFLANAKEGNTSYNSPVQFMQNKGQVTDQHGAVRKDIDVKIEANGVTMFVGDGEMHYQWVKSRESKVVSRESGASVHPPSPFGDTPFKGGNNVHSPFEGGKGDVEIYRMDVKLIGANKNAQVIFEEPTGYYENYYLAHTGEDGVSANGYGRVIYKNIYLNIDLVLYTEAKSKVKSQNPKENNLQSNIEHQTSNVKYDFIVHPGGNPADIQLRYEGATELKLVDGSLVASTPYGTITEAVPYSYNAETKQQVASAYKLSGNTLSFDVGNYTGTLVIDPVLVWGTYYGGTGDDRGASVCVDIYENIYICGATLSSNNIATTGAHQASWMGTWDGFIAKFDSSGTRLWGTYYGSATGEEVLGSISCDKWGNVYVAGYCDSAATVSALITTGAHQVTKGGGSLNFNDALLVKLNTNGQRQWATLYGGNNEEQNIVATCDPLGNVYLAGGTSSTNNIFGTNGTHKPTINTSSNNADGFLAKFNTNGVRLWGTYYGGDTGLYRSDNIKTVACDVSGNVYIGGYTNSDHAIATTGAHQSTPGSQTDGFIAKMNGNNGTRIWGTYYGGSSGDNVQGITINADNNILIAGSTSSTNNIASPGTYQTIKQGGEDAFLAKFTSTGTRLWATYYGGTDLEHLSGIAVYAGGAFITGYTTSTSTIAITGSHQSSYGGGISDAFLAQFNATGQLDWASYYGGSGNEFIPGSSALHFYTDMVAGSNAGRIYMGCMTTSSTNIATNGVHQSSFAQGSNSNYADAILAAFETDTVVYVPQRYTDTVWCPGDTVRIVYGVNQPFRTGNAFAVELSNATGGFTSPVTIGSHNANTGDTITCVIPMSTPAGTGYRIRIIADSPGRVSWDNQWDIRINPLPNLVAGSNSPVCTGDTLHLTGSSTNTGITWAWSGPNSFGSSAEDTFIANAQLADSGKYILKATLNSTGCSLSDTTTVEMRLTPAKPTASSNSPVCETLPLTLTTGSTTSGVSYTWSGPGSYSSSTQNPTVTTSATSSHAGDYVSTATLNGCSSKDTTTVVVLPKPAKPTAGATNSPLCARQDLQLTASNITGASYAWYGPSAFTAYIQNPVRANVQMSDAGAYYVYATLSGCVSDTDSVMVTVNTDPFVNIFPTPGASICQGKQAIFTAVPTNGGNSPSYTWLVNGIATGGTGISYSTTTLNNGDAVSCAMTSTGTCATPFTDTSNAITMTVQPILSPTVTMTADNMPPWNGGLTVTFTATPTHGGANPEYQWKRNGQDITGATGATWGVIVNALNTNEDICVVLKSSYECAVPDTAMSNCITTAFTGIVGEATNKGFKIYPNPVRDILHVEAPPGLPQGEVTVELIDVLGRKCATASLYPPKGETNIVDVRGLAPGVYIVRVNGVVAGRVVKE